MIGNRFTDDRGQVGIGTLIVFIALVLVAAIAAGVLINTAGFLQTQAEETGQDSTDQVADNINVIGEVGNVIGLDRAGDDEIDSNAVYEARMTVQRSAGSDDIDLTGLSIQWVGDNGFAQLVHTSEVDAPDIDTGTGDEIIEDDITDLFADTDTDRGDAAYLVEVITAESDGDAVLTDDGDRYEIVIPLSLVYDDDSDEIGLLDEFAVDEPGADDTDPELSDLNTDFAGLDVDSDTTDSSFDNLDLELLEEGEEASLEITTDAGATRNVAISAPDTLIDEEGETVTL